MKKSVLALTVLLASLFFSCKKSSSDVDPCGPTRVKEKEFTQTSAIITNSEHWTEDNILTALYGTERTFSVMCDLSELCPGKPGDLSFEVKTTAGQTGLVVADIEGKAILGGSTKKTELCRKSEGNIKLNHSYDSYLSIDFKPTFGSNPANVKAVLTISFHSLGSTDQDIAFFRSIFKELRVGIAGYAY